MYQNRYGYEPAHTSEVKIAGKGVRKTDSAPVYAVTSASEPARLHLVVWDLASAEWQCDCPRWHWRHHCRHIEAVNARLAEQRSGVLTSVGAAALQAWRDAQREHPITARPSDSAPRRGPAAFSLLKQ
jgi:hypothetical protein